MNRLALIRFPSLLALSLLPLAGCSSSTPAGGTGVLAPDAGDADAATTDAPSGGTQCSSARDQLLLPIDKVSTGVVSVVSDTGGKKTIYVDASGGGLGTAAKSPRVYVDLGTGTRVALTDKSAPASKDWDLALKRSLIFTNGGDAGAGVGGAVAIEKVFASVSAAEVSAAKPLSEKFFDKDCNAQLDRTNAPLTTFTDWYDYDQVTNIPTPKPGFTYVVVGGQGKRFKVGIKAYDALPDGGSRNNMSTGFYLLEVTEVPGQ